MGNLIKYLIAGIYFGFLLVKSEVVSWFRIQEMFRFDSFHMYGILISAILIALISIQIIKR
ncbi:MAG: YeeE/YedE family protein, partial [Balneolaceae bacterium]